jgi:hypothetical protein
MGRWKADMAAKLGQAIYWGCRVIAAMLTAFPILAMSYNWIEGAPLQPQYVMLGFFALAGIVIWLIGRAAKYVLAGL